MKVFRTEYPRPEFVREKWISLNGEWDFEFDFGNSGIRIGDFGNAKLINYRNREMLEKKFSRKINVPFCPESDLSGIGYKDFINACWYKKEVEYFSFPVPASSIFRWIFFCCLLQHCY